MLLTTHGPLDESSLLRTVGFEDRPTEFVVWVEWKMREHGLCPVCEVPTNPKVIGGLVLVRRDAHVILKEASVAATAIVGGLG